MALRHLSADSDLPAFFIDDAGLHIFDQRALPEREAWVVCTSVEDAAVAIETLTVRGAPAIGGCAAAAAAYWAQTEGSQVKNADAFRAALQSVLARLARTRPTAVNLFYAISALEEAVDAQIDADLNTLVDTICTTAEQVVADDKKACAGMAQHGTPLFNDDERVFTICHTGALATCGSGTALGVLKKVNAERSGLRVVALETRPLLQGARLTAWECLRSKLDVTLITDGMAAFTAEKMGMTKAIVGADRIAANGDVANKIGTYNLATVCARFSIPFYVAAPTSTFDLNLEEGSEIPIEERTADEIRHPRGTQFAPKDVPVFNPAFDVTPHDLIRGIITEKGVWHAPFRPEDCPARAT